MSFQLKRYQLPHVGVMPGARGLKRRYVQPGTKVYCIVHGTLMYWACYLDEQQALRVIDNFEAIIKKEAKRHIPLDTLLAWNFKSTFPKRVVRPSHSDKESTDVHN